MKFKCTYIVGVMHQNPFPAAGFYPAVDWTNQVD